MIRRGRGRMSGSRQRVGERWGLVVVAGLVSQPLLAQRLGLSCSSFEGESVQTGFSQALLFSRRPGVESILQSQPKK
jgi:hypothetical protein